MAEKKAPAGLQVGGSVRIRAIRKWHSSLPSEGTVRPRDELPVDPERAAWLVSIGNAEFLETKPSPFGLETKASSSSPEGPAPAAPGSTSSEGALSSSSTTATGSAPKRKSSTRGTAAGGSTTKRSSSKAASKASAGRKTSKPRASSD